jgi:phosphoribosyl 1,2-cyclic phosphodiesterase
MPVNVGRIPGTNIVIDAFTSPHDPEHTYLLSHFHADHYTGLKGAKWKASVMTPNIHTHVRSHAHTHSQCRRSDPPISLPPTTTAAVQAGKIYCSVITARLLTLELELDPIWIIPLLFDQEHQIGDVRTDG